MKVADYIVEYFIKRGITDVFGYPGGMVTHLMEALRRNQDRITAHVTYHEQSAAFAACAYAQTSGKPGMAYATSGPGATNLITGICNAYFDSIPVIFITGQVNSFEAKKNLEVRQRGFQETNIISMVKEVTKLSAYVEDAQRILYYLDKAFWYATQGRKGPVLLDIPMDIFQTEIEETQLIRYEPMEENSVGNVQTDRLKEVLETSLNRYDKPCILYGNGIKNVGLEREYANVATLLGIPIVCSMIAFDIMPNVKKDSQNINFGFIGAYGDRTANFIIAKCNLLIVIGSRLDVRQVGAKRENFAPNAKIIRIDIDDGELRNKIRENEVQFKLDIKKVLPILQSLIHKYSMSRQWMDTCREIFERLNALDESEEKCIIEQLSKDIPDNRIITTDVGQNQVWIAQAFQVKENQKVLFSGGHGAMGYSLPAAIGAYYGAKMPVISFQGDGGIQMNIQELQFIARENLPIKIMVLNNFALGMIRHFQEMYFDGKYYQTKKNGGYTVPDFCKIAKAYGIESRRIEHMTDLQKVDFTDLRPELVEILLKEDTLVLPKLEYGKPNQNQEPLLDRDIYNYLMKIGEESV